MLLVFALFVGGLVGIGLIIGQYFALANADIGLDRNAAPLYHIPEIDLVALQTRLWLALGRGFRLLVILVCIYPLLFIERGARFLSKSLHIFLEKRLHYKHEHPDR